MNGFACCGAGQHDEQLYALSSKAGVNKKDGKDKSVRVYTS